MAYAAVIEARKAAEENIESIRAAVRLRLEMRRADQDRKATQTHAKDRCADANTI